MTSLNKWYYRPDNDGIGTIYTRDTWVIPEEGTEIWCTGWKRGQTIKPYGDGCHVIVGISVYHCDELMGILDRWVSEGHRWGIDGVKVQREQQVDGRWAPVPVE